MGFLAEGGGLWSEVRFEMLLKLVAEKKEGKKKGKVCRLFLLSDSMTGFSGFFSPHRSAFTAQLKQTEKGRTSMHLILFKTKTKQTAGSWTRTEDCLKANLWTEDCSGCYFSTVCVISKCRINVFIFSFCFFFFQVCFCFFLSFFCNWLLLPPGLEKKKNQAA